MRLVDIDQRIFVPIVDESKGSVQYEIPMTLTTTTEQITVARDKEMAVQERWNAIFKPKEDI